MTLKTAYKDEKSNKSMFYVENASLHTPYASLHAPYASLHAPYASLHAPYASMHAHHASIHAYHASIHTHHASLHFPSASTHFPSASTHFLPANSIMREIYLHKTKSDRHKASFCSPKTFSGSIEINSNKFKSIININQFKN